MAPKCPLVSAHLNQRTETSYVEQHVLALDSWPLRRVFSLFDFRFNCALFYSNHLFIVSSDILVSARMLALIAAISSTTERITRVTRVAVFAQSLQTIGSQQHREWYPEWYPSLDYRSPRHSQRISHLRTQSTWHIASPSAVSLPRLQRLFFPPNRTQPPHLRRM